MFQILWARVEVSLFATFVIQNLDVPVACKLKIRKVPEKPSEITHFFKFKIKLKNLKDSSIGSEDILEYRACRPIALKLVSRAFAISWSWPLTIL